jgi:hypothetical protein
MGGKSQFHSCIEGKILQIPFYICKKEIATSIQAWKFLTAVVTVWGIIQLNVENIFISTSPVVFFFLHYSCG